jgi:hypothetical protein
MVHHLGYRSDVGEEVHVDNLDWLEILSLGVSIQYMQQQMVISIAVRA